MAPNGDPHALGELLRERRARLHPADVGLPAGRRRHPVLGPLDYTHVVLQVADRPDQSMVTYSAGHTPEHRPA
jgi:hypothetical protein